MQTTTSQALGKRLARVQLIVSIVHERIGLRCCSDACGGRVLADQNNLSPNPAALVLNRGGFI